MIKFLLVLLISFNAYSWVKPESFDSTYISLEEQILADTIRKSYKNAQSALSESILKTILTDEKNKISDEFHIPKYFKSSVHFWFSIYTQYSSKQVVIHDKENLDLVYNVIDFTDIHKSNIHRFAKAKLQNKLSLEYTRRLKTILKQLSTANFAKLNTEQFDVLRVIRNSSVKIPKSNRAKKKFFKGLSQRLRTQTGQRDMVYEGIIRSQTYFPFLKNKVAAAKLPHEVLAIPFLESSFNVKAISKVDAVGIWQFMEYTNNLVMPKKTSVIDYRRNPIVSTISAFHLLKENKLILRTWDLAVTAYNSGTRNLVNARRKYKRKVKKLTLEYVLENYKHPSLGFASKNFYSEFLALVYVLAYKDIIYPLDGIEGNTPFTKPEDIGIYVAKCRILPKAFFKVLKKSSPRIEELNMHILKPNKFYPRGTLFVSDIKLTSRRYYKLNNYQLFQKFPKKYYQFIYNKKCN